MANTTSTKTARFIVNFFDKQIIGTKASFNKASKGSGAEYEELTAKIAAHPDFELVIKEPKSKSTKVKRTYDGLDYKFMEAYIATKADSDRFMKEYEAVKKMAASCGTKAYPMTKKWFLGKFSSEENPFDMDEAREAIAKFRIQEAGRIAAELQAADSANKAEEEPLETATLDNVA